MRSATLTYEFPHPPLPTPSQPSYQLIPSYPKIISFSTHTKACLSTRPPITHSNGIKVRFLARPLVVKRCSIAIAVPDLESRRRINMGLEIQRLKAALLLRLRGCCSARAAHLRGS